MNGSSMPESEAVNVIHRLKNHIAIIVGFVDLLISECPDDDPKRAEQETTEFLAAYYGGGVHSRGTMGLGPAAAVIETLQRYAKAGATDLCIRFVGDRQLEQLERFTAEVLPALR